MHNPAWLNISQKWLSKNKLKGVIGTIFFLVVVAVLMLILFIDSILKPILSAKLKTAILTASDSLYRIDFTNADLHILNGKAVLYNVSLIADTTIYARMKRNNTAPGELFKVDLKQLTIEDAHPFKMYFHKQLDIGQIQLSSPKIQFDRYFIKADTNKRKSTTLYQKVSKIFHSIKVGHINLNDVRITQNNYLGPKLAVSTLKELNVSATGLLIDSTTQKDATRTLFCEEIVANLNHFKLNTADGLYQFKIEKLSASTKTARLFILNGEMIPLPAESFFLKTKKLDKYTLKLNSVTISGFDLMGYYNHQSFGTKRVAIKNGYFEVYPNPHGKPKPGNRFVTYPNFVLTHLKTGLNVDTVDFKSIKVVYTQYNAKSHHVGSVIFNNTTGRFVNITNEKTKIARNNISKVNLTTYLMSIGKVDLNAQFNLNSRLYAFSYQGHLGPTELRAGNMALQPLGLIKVNTGNVRSFDFNINSNKTISTGKITFLYNNLKVAVLRNDKEKGYSKRSVVSLFANLLVIENDNPSDSDHSARSISIRYIRPVNTPFFGNIWQTLLSGIKATVGLGNKQSTQTKAPKQTKDPQKHISPFKKIGKTLSKIF